MSEAKHTPGRTMTLLEDTIALLAMSIAVVCFSILLGVVTP